MRGGGSAVVAGAPGSAGDQGSNRSMAAKSLMVKVYKRCKICASYEQHGDTFRRAVHEEGHSMPESRVLVITPSVSWYSLTTAHILYRMPDCAKYLPQSYVWRDYDMALKFRSSQRVVPRVLGSEP